MTETLFQGLEEQEYPRPPDPEGKDASGLDRRVQHAIDQSDCVASPELGEAVKDFYSSHYRLASVIELGLESPLEESHPDASGQKAWLQDIIHSSQFKPEEIESWQANLIQKGSMSQSPYEQEITPLLAQVRLKRLESPEDNALKRAELMALSAATQALFAEASVGVSTLGVEEADLVTSLHRRLKEQLNASDLFEHQEGSLRWRAKDLGNPNVPQTLRGSTLTEDPLYFINREINTFWRDCRFAGQLLFHNTGHFQDLSKNGEIMPRRMQRQKYGATNIQTAEATDGHIHSPTTHWSEEFDPRSYRGEQGNENGGTIAMPLWKIIQVAPFARDAQYGLLTLKTNEGDYAKPGITINQGVGNISYGGDDGQGSGGIDRTFYASPHDVSADAPLEEAPDGYTLPIDEDSFWVQLGSEDVAKKEWAFANLGQQPTPYLVPAKQFTGDYWSQDVANIEAWRKKRTATIGSAIKLLQAQSIGQRPQELVVPLRAGIMDFYIPDDSWYEGKHRAHFTQVNSIER